MILWRLGKVMIVLGLAGGIDLPYERQFNLLGTSHDAAAVLVVDGKVVAAIEEERLNRIKHTDKAPASAIRFCLDSYGITLKEVDKIAIYGTENYLNDMLLQYHLINHKRDFIDIRAYIQRVFKETLGEYVDESKFIFVNHHFAHAVSAFAMSGFEESLVLSIDAEGDGISGMILEGHGNKLSIQNTLSSAMSLGTYYVRVIQFLGYDMFDEYKVMGLAPYGDAKKYRRYFKKFYELLPEGRYTIYAQNINILSELVFSDTNKESLEQVHKDIAAALQESLEEIVFHVVKYYKEKTGYKKLCLAGGVAHNCSMNGKILYSGMFEDVFVQPASHDAGSAIGAALHTFLKEVPNGCCQPIEHVYWGSDIGNDDSIGEVLGSWKEFISYEKSKDIARETAILLSEGSVIGLVQGKSEFGPRALGNRSIIADPRPEKNKDIINEMVKKREAYRPFAPSVIEECLNEYFEVPSGDKQFPYMTFVLKVKENKQKILGATTHVDGTARVQTVSRDTNPMYWSIINEFGKITGIPVVLNTSFNNNMEPIVNSIEDAIVCFLTTKLDYIVIGNYIVSRKQVDSTVIKCLVPKLPEHIVLNHHRKCISFEKWEDDYRITNNFSSRYNVQISKDIFSILCNVDCKKTIEILLNDGCIFDAEKEKTLIEEIIKLWALRMVALKPRSIY